MNLTDKLKKEIDKMSYKEMLYLWRFAPMGDDLLQDESGTYFVKSINLKRADCKDEAKISKEVGWDFQCTWMAKKDNLETSCENRLITNIDTLNFMYCPYCSRRIKREE